MPLTMNVRAVEGHDHVVDPATGRAIRTDRDSTIDITSQSMRLVNQGVIVRTDLKRKAKPAAPKAKAKAEAPEA